MVYLMIIVSLLVVVFLYIRKIEKKKAQAIKNYHSLLDHMPIVYIKYRLLHNKEGHLVDYIIEDANPSFEKHFGPVSAALGKKGSALSLPRDNEVFLKRCSEVIKNNREEAFIFQYGPTGRSYNVIMIPCDVAGNIDLFYIDIMKQVYVENELIAAKDKAEEANRLKSAFLANITHEIRTPLNAIVGFSELLMQESNEEEKKEYMRMIEVNNFALVRLVNDLLDLSQLEAGMLEFNYMDFDLNETLRELEYTYQLKTPDVKIRFEYSMTDCWINTERERLLQVLANLLSNAIKFTSQGRVKFGYQREGSHLHFYVSDNGCGIPKRQLEHIFGRFVKLDKFSPGPGLGLAIAETIVRRMQGKIGVESEEGKGATFWFTIPYKPVFPVRT